MPWKLATPPPSASWSGSVEEEAIIVVLPKHLREAPCPTPMVASPKSAAPIAEPMPYDRDSQRNLAMNAPIS